MEEIERELVAVAVRLTNMYVKAKGEAMDGDVTENIGNQLTELLDRMNGN